MSEWLSPVEVPADLGRTVVTIGVFDGVHRGHQAVIAKAGSRARELDLPVVAVTFDPNPLAVLRPEAAPPDLTTIDERVALLRQAGADHVLVLPFGRDRSEQSPEEFVDDVLVGLLHAKVVVVGRDFRFGHKAAGTLDLLAELGAARDFEVDEVTPVGTGDVTRWSSTYVRQRVAGGDVASAAVALGRPFRVEGVVVHGDQRGRALGYPTANLPVRGRELVPADGVYAGWLVRLDRPDGGGLPAAVSVGVNPTFQGRGRRVEAYVLGPHDLELYGVPVAIEFVQRIRGMEAFESVDELAAAMERDVKAVRELLNLSGPSK